ncbi:hypothetical protein TrRE_jg2070, partial [Triparma retinervis]
EEEDKPGDGSKAGEAADKLKLFQCTLKGGGGGWGWEPINVYDDQDLADDCLLLLVMLERGEAYAWIGGAFGEEVGGEWLGKTKFGEGWEEAEEIVGDYGKVGMVKQGEEDEEFWEAFEEGY